MWQNYKKQTNTMLYSHIWYQNYLDEHNLLKFYLGNIQDHLLMQNNI